MKSILAFVIVLVVSTSSVHATGVWDLDWIVADTTIRFRAPGDTVRVRLYLANRGTIDQYGSVRIEGAAMADWSVIGNQQDPLSPRFFLRRIDTIWVDLQFVGPLNPSMSSIKVIADGHTDDTMAIVSLYEPLADVAHEPIDRASRNEMYYDGERMHGPAEEFELHICDLRGSLVQRSSHSPNEIVALHHLARAGYFLRVYPRHSAPRTLRILKR